MKKEFFSEPSVDVIVFINEDVVTASGSDPFDDEEDDGWPGHGYGDKNHDHDKDNVHDRGNHGHP